VLNLLDWRITKAWLCDVIAVWMHMPLLQLVFSNCVFA